MNIKLSKQEEIVSRDQMSIEEVKPIVDRLGKDMFFGQTVYEIRKRYSIPTDGFETIKGSKEEQLNLSSNQEFIKDYQNLTVQSKLSLFWFQSIREFILYNKLFTPMKYPIIVQKYNAAELDYSVPILIITEKISKTEFIDYIDNNWDNIKKDFNLPKTKTHKMSDLKILQEVDILRKEKKTFPEISEILINKYPDKEKYCSESNLRTQYGRYLKKLM